MRKKKLPIALILSVAGRASQRPILYPSAQLDRVGTEVANRDSDDCLRQAENDVPSRSRACKVAAGAAICAATNAAVGAAAGAAGGSTVGQAGTGAAMGGAGGVAGAATRGIVHGLMRQQEATPVQKDYVNRCLRERGDSPIGWE